MKRTIIFLALMLPSLAFAQWRVGANVGMSYNHPTIDKQYMTDLVYKDRVCVPNWTGRRKTIVRRVMSLTTRTTSTPTTIS